jgi:hypothetical protein
MSTRSILPFKNVHFPKIWINPLVTSRQKCAAYVEKFILKGNWHKKVLYFNLVPLGPFLKICQKILPAPHNFFRPLLCFATEISNLWQHCLATLIECSSESHATGENGCRREQNKSAKHFIPQPGCRQSIHTRMLSFESKEKTT